MRIKARKFSVEFLLALVFGTVSIADEAPRTVDWHPSPPESTSVRTELVNDPNLGQVWKIHNPADQPVTVRLAELQAPGVEGQYYGISGRIKYENVEGTGYLEMWNVFRSGEEGGQEARFFTRTLAPQGSMQGIKSTSDWREFRLPFDASGGTFGRPTRLEINLHFPGKGSVWLASGTLEDFPTRSALFKVPGAWWSPQAAGVMGGVFGTGCGLLGALIGILGGKGKAKGFVFSSSYLLIALGVVSVIVGLIALGLGQPYEVWFVLILVGAILSLVVPLNLKNIRKAYESIEIKKMRSLDSLG